MGTQGTIRQISKPYALVVQPTNTTETRYCYIYTSNKIVLTDWKKAVVNFQGVFIEDTGGTVLRLGTSHTQVANPELRYKSYAVSAGNNSIVLDVSDLIGEYYLVIYGFLGGGVNDRWYSCLITDFYLEA